jgi:H+/Cl- antiporter ClcA
MRSSTQNVGRIAVVTVLTGLGAGLIGIALSIVLDVIQHVAFGYELHELIGRESFFEGVSAASPQRRVVVLAICGLVAAGGWYLLDRYARPLVSVDHVIRTDDPRMPVVATTADGLLQIVTVALGSPLGREVAPRQISATFAGWVSQRAGLTVESRRVMLACGAGAGLAAVYNSPFGGAMFALEVLLRTFRIDTVVIALSTSAIAVVVAWSVLANEPVYAVPSLSPSASLIVWAIVTGPLVGLSAAWFRRLESRARAHPPRDWRLPVAALVNFTAIGFLAISFPQLLGNGRAPAQLGFSSELSIGLAAALLVLRTAITASSLRAGARGGMLTPSLSNGALLGIVLGGLWSMIWPGAPLGAFAIVAATSFLASAMNMPLTAVVLLVEFTWIDQAYLVPMLLSVATSVVVARATAPPAPVAQGADRAQTQPSSDR